MFKPDPETWLIFLFICAFALVVLYALWPYIVAVIVLYAIARGFTSPHHHSNRNRRCRRRCRRWRKW